MNILTFANRDDWETRYRNISARDAYRRRLLELARLDPSIFCLDSDMGGLETGFAAELPDQYADVGIAEANLVSVAVGMAKIGLRPVVNTMATFASARACEQIKVDVARNAAPVTIVGSHAGASAGHLGPTHHALEDIAILRSMPNIAIVVPSDAFEAELAIEAAIYRAAPTYIRLGRQSTPMHHGRDYIFRLGQADKRRDGDDIALFCCGPTALSIGISASDHMRELSVHCGVYNFHTVKPLDKEQVIEVAKKVRGIVTIEEHGAIGGFGAAVAEVTAVHHPVLQRFVAAPDHVIDTVGDEAYLLEAMGISHACTVAAITEILDASMATPSMA